MLKHVTNKLFLLIIGINWFSSSYAQKITSYEDFTMYNHTTHHIDRLVSGIYQDNLGFIWITGNENIYRYDGTTFESILNIKDKDFQFPQIEPGRDDMLQDDRGRYWFLTTASLIRWDPKKPSQNAWSKFGRNIQDSIPLPPNRMHRMAMDSKGYIWIVFDEEDLYKIHPETGKAIQHIDFRIKEPGRRKSEIDAMYYNIADNRIYFGADHLRLIAVNPDNGTIEYPHEGLYNLLKRDHIFDEYTKYSVIDFTKDDNDWWLTLPDNIIIRYTYKKDTYHIFSSKNQNKVTEYSISRIKRDKQGLIWNSNLIYGLNTIDPLTNKRTKIIASNSGPDQPFDYILDIFFDKNNVMWLGTNKGLAKFDVDEHLFKIYNTDIESTSGTTLTYFQDSFENEFIGTTTGLFHKSGSQKPFSKISFNPSQKNKLQIHNIQCRNKNNFLFGTDKGVYQYNHLIGEVSELEVRGELNDIKLYQENPAHIIVFDTIGDEPVIWMGSKYRYLYQYNEKTKQIKAIIPIENDSLSLPHQTIMDIVRTKEGNIWIGTWGGGLSKMVDKNKITFTSWQPDDKDFNSIQNIHITKLDITKTGNIWLSTGTGVDIFNHQSFKHLSLSSGTSRYSSAVVKGNNGEMWTLTGNELIKWNEKGELLRIFQKGKHSFNSMFLKRDGKLILWDSKTHQFNDFSKNAVYVFDVKNSLSHQKTPETRLTYFEAGNVDLSELLYQKNINLRHDQNTIKFSFACLSYTLSLLNKFMWKLEGADEEWVYSKGNYNFATYSTLRPGKYTFRVTSCNISGNWDKTGASFVFTILPPWYQTWWFNLVMGFATLSLVWYFIQMRTKRLLDIQKTEIEKEKAVENERYRISRDMHDDLGSGLSAIHLLSNFLKNETLDENSHQQIEKIANSSTELNQKLREIVWSMNPGHDYVQNLADFIRRYVSDLSSIHKNVELSFQTINGLPDINIPKMTQKEIFLCVKEAVHNAIKHSGAKNINTTLQMSENELKVVVFDDGKGFDPESALHRGGQGLRNIEERMKSIHGKVHYQMLNGCRMELTMPLK